MATAAELLLDRQSQVRQNLSQRVEVILRNTWNNLGSWRDEDVDRFLAQVLPVIEASQVTVATVTETYLLDLMAVYGLTPAAVGYAADMSNLRPVPPEEVYRRPFVATYTALANGAEFPAALAVGLDRLIRLGEDDLSLAHRNTSQAVLSNTNGVVGYRRVIRPELARSGSCGLCFVASQNFYKKERLMPVHTRCHCEVMAITSRFDEGDSINAVDLNEVYSVAGSTKASDLKNTRVQVAEHGELGPILRRGDDNVASPDL